MGGTTVPGLLFDDPQDPTNGLDTLALSESRALSEAARLKPTPAGREHDASVAVAIHTAKGTAFVHFRLFSLSPDGREILLWHSAGARTVASQERVQAAAAAQEGLSGRQRRDQRPARPAGTVEPDRHQLRPR